MKKILLWLILIALATVLLAQNPPADKGLSRDGYLRKGRTQSGFAWALLGAGAICFIIPATDDGSTGASNGGGFNFDLDFDGYFYGAGIVLIGTSIPLFIASSRNKEKAATVSTFIRFEKKERETAIVFKKSRSFPVAGIRLSLR